MKAAVQRTVLQTTYLSPWHLSSENIHLWNNMYQLPVVDLVKAKGENEVKGADVLV